MKPRLLSFPLACSLVAAACATTPAPSAAPPSPLEASSASGQVRLNFGWKAGDRGEVAEQRVRTLEFAGKQRVTRTDASWRIEVSEAEGGLAIATRELKMTGGEPAVAQMASLLSKLAESAPLVVGAQGEPLRLDGATEIEAAIADWMQRSLPENRRTTEIVAALRASFGKEAIQAREFEAWTQMLAFWSGGDLEVGSRYQNPDKTHGESSFAAESLVPCTAEETELRCVRLVTHATAPDQMRAAARAQMASAVQSLLPGAEFSVESVTDETVLIAEPAALRPFRYDRTKTTTLGVEFKGQQHTMTVTDASTRAFEWASPYARPTSSAVP